MKILKISSAVLFLLFGILSIDAYRKGEIDLMILYGFMMILWQNNLLAPQKNINE